MNYTAIANNRQDQAFTENNRHITNRPKVLPEGRVLYNCHISTHTIRYPSEFEFHYLDSYVGGSATRLIATNTHPNQDKKTKASTQVTAKRSVVSKFSFKSRRRLLIAYAKINKTKLKKPKMLTLTYPSTYSDNFQVWKKNLDEFVAFNLCRLLPNIFVMWKLEPQKRGAPHYHLLIFGLILSIILMAVAANLISGWIKKYKWIAWFGLLAILFVAIELIYTDIKTLFL